MKLFKIKKTFSITNISKENWEKVNNCKDLACGLTGWFSRYIADIPQSYKKLFLYSCKKHDLGTRRGGSILNFIENNWVFIKFTALDITRYSQISRLPTLNLLFKLIGFIILWLTTIPLIFMVGLFVFPFGDQKELNQILSEAKC